MEVDAIFYRRFVQIIIPTLDVATESLWNIHVSLMTILCLCVKNITQTTEAVCRFSKRVRLWPGTLII